MNIRIPQFDGVRVLDLTNVLAGPFATLHLALLGAEVIKVENPRDGDLARKLGICTELNDQLMGTSFLAQNANKKSLTLDLKHPRGQEVLHRLAATADGLLGNLRGDQPEKLELTYEFLKQANPRIVCAHLSAYGRDGARKGWPGYDYLMQGEAGRRPPTS